MKKYWISLGNQKNIKSRLKVFFIVSLFSPYEYHYKFSKTLSKTVAF